MIAIALALLIAVTPAHAQPADAEVAPDSAWEVLQRLPPRYAWEIGFHVAFSRVAYFREETPPWVGFGLRGGWGRVFASGHRLGAALVFNADGPIPLFWTLSLEPQATWDFIAGNLQLGVSVGPSIQMHNRLELTRTDTVYGLAPMAAVRIGYSDAWTRVGRRFFVVAEPKTRWVDGVIDWSIALVVGSGSGR